MNQSLVRIGFCFALSFLISGLLVGSYLHLARKRWLDRPGARSSHVRPTPTGGGVAALGGWLLAAGSGALTGALPGGRALLAALTSSIVLGILGFLDDLWDLPRSARYAGHLAVAAGSIAILGSPIPENWLPPWIGWIGLLLGFSYLVNAFNFMDGADALVGGTGCIILGFFAVFTSNPTWLVLAGAYLGFLLYNLPPARLFMGDAGSTALGGLVGVMLLSGAREDALRVEHLVVLGPLIGDSAYTLCRRLARRENVFRAHHSHVYQRILRAGHSHRVVSSSYAIATASAGALVTAFGRLGAAAAALGFIALVAALEVYFQRRRVPFTRPLSK